MATSVVLTVISGVVIYVSGQIVQRYLLDPLLEFKRARAAIVKHLILNSTLLTVELEHKDLPHEAVKSARKGLTTKSIELGSELIASARSVPFYSVFALLLRYPSLKGTLRVTSDLVDMANNVTYQENSVSDSLRDDRISAFSRLAKDMRFKFSYTDLQLVASGYFANGKSLEHVVTNAPNAFSPEVAKYLRKKAKLNRGHNV